MQETCENWDVSGLASAPQTQIIKNSLANQACEVLRQQIVRGELPPGHRLNIYEIATQLGISRTPVKEAFNRLSHEGLLTIHPQSGTFVSRLGLSQIREVFEARLMLELWSAPALFCGGRWSPMEAERLLARCEELFQSKEDFDFATFAICDRELHTSIVSASGNRRISRMYESVYPYLQMVRVYWGRSRERALRSHREHIGIVDAINRSDSEAAVDLLRSHITGSQDDIIRLLTTDGSGLITSQGEAD